MGRHERHFGGIFHNPKRFEESALFMKIKNNALNDETHYEGWTKTKTPKKSEDIFISIHRGLKSTCLRCVFCKDVKDILSNKILK